MHITRSSLYNSYSLFVSDLAFCNFSLYKIWAVSSLLKHVCLRCHSTYALHLLSFSIFIRGLWITLGFLGLGPDTWLLFIPLALSLSISSFNYASNILRVSSGDRLVIHFKPPLSRNSKGTNSKSYKFSDFMKFSIESGSLLKVS